LRIRQRPDPSALGDGAAIYGKALARRRESPRRHIDGEGGREYAILLAAVVGFIGFVVWDQVTMQERITKKYNAARARNEPFVFTKTDAD